MRRKAPASGLPSSVLIAAKLPAPAMTTVAMGGASLFTRWTVSAPSPPPMAMSGASGPSTAPRARVAMEARTTPGRSIASGGPPPTLKPSAGECPLGRACTERPGPPPGPTPQQRYRPPRRGPREAQCRRQPLVELMLEPVDQLEVEVRDDRDGHAEEGGHGEQEQVSLAAKELQWIRGVRQGQPFSTSFSTWSAVTPAASGHHRCCPTSLRRSSGPAGG